MQNFISTIEEIIEDAKQGKPFILVDDESRENEGDLIIPSEFVTPEIVNFMIKKCSGIICLAMPKHKAEALEIKSMVSENKSSFSTPFGVSIEAKNGITTGVSAVDRATTIKAATGTGASKHDIVSPGHVFPLIAKEGGVFVREGHTEASVDMCLLAGLNGCAAICEVMNEDGTISKMPELIEFSKQYNIKIGTIADLIKYRSKKENFMFQVLETNLENGAKLITFKEKYEDLEHFAIIKGEKSKAYVRIQSFNLFDEITNKACSFKMLETLQKQYENLIFIIINNGKNWKMEDLKVKEYGKGSEILKLLNLEKIKLLTKTKGRTLGAISGFGITIEEEILI